jgi:hypothetical protein
MLRQAEAFKDRRCPHCVLHSVPSLAAPAGRLSQRRMASPMAGQRSPPHILQRLCWYLLHWPEDGVRWILAQRAGAGLQQHPAHHAASPVWHACPRNGMLFRRLTQSLASAGCQASAIHSYTNEQQDSLLRISRVDQAGVVGNRSTGQQQNLSSAGCMLVSTSSHRVPQFAEPHASERHHHLNSAQWFQPDLVQDVCKDITHGLCRAAIHEVIRPDLTPSPTELRQAEVGQSPGPACAQR